MATHLHIDCFSGVSGDMTLGALLDLGVPENVVQIALDSLGLPAKLRIEKVKKGGFAASKATVEAEPEHAHRHLRHILEILDRGNMTAGAKELASKMFHVLAEAEAHCHGTTIERVHFHEVGAIDSIFDFVGIAVGFDWLAPERVTCTPVPTGTGFVDCQHGRMPVPAPAVAKLLQGIPLASTDIFGELTTPTGAAFLKVVVDEFLPQPAMTIEKIGLGAGTRDLPNQPNVLRLLWGVSESAPEDGDSIWQLETNLDSRSGEAIGYCLERLFEAGVLDAWTTPIGMKKNRPGTMISVLCRDAQRRQVEQILFEETGTLGVRRRLVERTTLPRRTVEVQTSWGAVRVKIGEFEGGQSEAPEFEDCARIAREHAVPLTRVYQETLALFRQRQAQTQAVK